MQLLNNGKNVTQMNLNFKSYQRQGRVYQQFHKFNEYFQNC